MKVEKALKNNSTQTGEQLSPQYTVEHVEELTQKVLQSMTDLHRGFLFHLKSLENDRKFPAIYSLLKEESPVQSEGDILWYELHTCFLLSSKFEFFLRLRFVCEFPGEWHIVRQSKWKTPLVDEFVKHCENYFVVINEVRKLMEFCL